MKLVALFFLGGVVGAGIAWKLRSRPLEPLPDAFVDYDRSYREWLEEFSQSGATFPYEGDGALVMEWDTGSSLGLFRWQDEVRGE